MKTDKVSLIQFIEDNYDVGPIISLERIKNGINHKNYLVITTNLKYVLRIVEENISNQKNNMIPFMQYAETINFPCPKIIISNQKTTHFIVNKKLLLLMSYEPGEQGELETITIQKINSFANTLAKFHTINWTLKHKSKNLELNHVFNLYVQYLPKIMAYKFENKDKFMKDMKSEYKILKKVLPNLFINLPKGLVHNDPTPWNTLFKKNDLSSLLDLESIGNGIFLLDIARALNIWCFKNNSLDKVRVDHFLKAYTKKRPLNQYEKDCLPMILRFVAFRHCVYFMGLFIKHKSNNPTITIDYDCLVYYRRIKNKELSKLLFV